MDIGQWNLPSRLPPLHLFEGRVSFLEDQRFYLDLDRVLFDLWSYNFCVSLGTSFNLSEYQIPYLLNVCFTES